MSKQNSSGKSGNDRADVKNPNNPAHKLAGDNKSNQKNPNHSDSKSKK